MSNEREQLIARLRRFAVVLEARGETYDAETCEQAIASLSAPVAERGQPRHYISSDGRRSLKVMGMTHEQEMMFKRLIKCAHRQAMMSNGQIAQDIRLVLNDARRYWHLRDESNPDVCRYYLASDDEASKFNDPAHVDRQIDTDRANMEARDRARKA